MANGWFRKRPPGREIPEGLWTQCPKCRELLFNKELERNLKVCLKCGYHFHLSALERIELLLDEGSFQERDAELTSVNPLDFPRYTDKLERYRHATSQREGIVSGEGAVAGMRLCIAATDVRFMRGAMGSVVGERLMRATERATKLGAPVVLVSGSGGGALMEEGLLSLMQMAKTSGAIARHHAAGLLTIVLLTDMSLAGIMASWGSLGDVILAEPGAKIGFVGERVSQQAHLGKAPSDFHTAEFQLRCGQIDAVVPRRELRDTIANLLRFAGAPAAPATPQPAIN